MWAALTGTPGTGKSSVSLILREEGVIIKDIKSMAEEAQALGDGDPNMDALEIDVDKLKGSIEERKYDIDLVEGHLAHLLGLPWVVILRCRPSVLKDRLGERGYGPEKLRANVESEALDVILVEALDRYDKTRVFEVDTSIKGVGDVASEVVEIMETINGYEKGRLSTGELASRKKEKGWAPGNLDWSDDFMAVMEGIQ